jgi:hypothetical protein
LRTAASIQAVLACFYSSIRPGDKSNFHQCVTVYIAYLIEDSLRNSVGIFRTVSIARHLDEHLKLFLLTPYSLIKFTLVFTDTGSDLDREILKIPVDKYSPIIGFLFPIFVIQCTAGKQSDGIDYRHQNRHRT